MTSPVPWVPCWCLFGELYASRVCAHDERTQYIIGNCILRETHVSLFAAAHVYIALAADRLLLEPHLNTSLARSAIDISEYSLM